jgi:hypothetical protein
MVSEDSDQLGSGFLAIHRRDHLDDVSQTGTGKVIARGDSAHAVSKLLEVAAFCASQRVLLKEWDDDPQEIRTSSDGIPVHMLAMVVIAGVEVDLSDTKEGAELLKTTQTAGTLCHHELAEYLNAGRVAASVWAVRLPHDTD